MKPTQVLLYPFSLLYLLITSLRNWLYDRSIFVSFEFTLPVINVGNLRVGGTGKTPMVEYLIKYLIAKGYQPGIISRGYGRKTKGFRLADNTDTAKSIGDEPMQYYLKFGQSVPVAVGEERVLAIPHLLSHHEELDTIVLDDAFQHRKVKAAYNIVLSAFGSPFFDDQLLPSGRLRESRAGISRANVVIFTKCPEKVDEATKEHFKSKVEQCSGRPLPVYFTTIKYGEPRPLLINSRETIKKDIVLVTGIAQNASILAYVNQNFRVVAAFSFNDHHDYNKVDVQKIVGALKANSGSQMLTTEKDATKLRAFKSDFDGFDCFYLPIEVSFLENETNFLTELENTILQFH